MNGDGQALEMRASRIPSEALPRLAGIGIGIGIASLSELLATCQTLRENIDSDSDTDPARQRSL
jgi:hypothetical protein